MEEPPAVLNARDFDTLKRERLGREFERRILEERDKFQGARSSTAVPADELRDADGNSFEDKVYQAKARQDDGEPFRAVDLYQAALALGRTDRSWMTFAYINIGRCYMAVDRFEEALAFFQLNVEYLQAEGGNKLLCEAFTNVGVAFYALNKHALALQSHELSSRLAATLGYRRGSLRAAANLGNTYGAMGKFKQAVAHHEEQLSIAKELGDLEAVGRACYHLHNDHNSLRNYDAAERYKALLEGDGKGEAPCAARDRMCGDWAPRTDQRAGWLVYHSKEKSRLFPPKLARTKAWFTFKDGLLSSRRSVKTGLRARAVLRAADILDVVAETPPPGVGPAAPHGKGKAKAAAVGFFRVETDERCHHLAAPTAREAELWMAALQKGRAAQSSSFARTGFRPRMNLHKAAFESFQGGAGASNGTGGVDRSNPLFESPVAAGPGADDSGAFELVRLRLPDQDSADTANSGGNEAYAAPSSSDDDDDDAHPDEHDGYETVLGTVQETTFSADVDGGIDSTVLPAEGLYQSAASVRTKKREQSLRRSLRVDSKSGAGGIPGPRLSLPVRGTSPRGARADTRPNRHSTSRIDQGRSITYTVRCLGWRQLDGQGSPVELQVACEDIAASPRADAKHRLLLTPGDDWVEVSAKARRRRSSNALPELLWRHRLAGVRLVACVGECVVLCGLDEDELDGSCQAFAYRCSDAVVASGLATILNRLVAVAKHAAATSAPALPVRAASVRRKQPISTAGYDVLPAHLANRQGTEAPYASLAEVLATKRVSVAGYDVLPNHLAAIRSIKDDYAQATTEQRSIDAAQGGGAYATAEEMQAAIAAEELEAENEEDDGRAEAEDGVDAEVKGSGDEGAPEVAELEDTDEDTDTALDEEPPVLSYGFGVPELGFDVVDTASYPTGGDSQAPVVVHPPQSVLTLRGTSDIADSDVDEMGDLLFVLSQER